MAISIEHIRKTTASIADRLHTDARFKAQILHDPEAILAAAGLPALLALDSPREHNIGEVNGFVVGPNTSCSYTCLGSGGCPDCTY